MGTLLLGFNHERTINFTLPDGRVIKIKNVGARHRDGRIATQIVTRVAIDAPADVKITRDDFTANPPGNRVGAPVPLSTAPSLAVTEGASTRPPAATGFGAAGGEGGR